MSATANGKRTTSNAIVRMISGATTAPVARTTPKSVSEMPKKMKDGVTIRFMWLAISSAAEAGGRNRPNIQVLSASIASTIEPVSSTLYSTPTRAMAVTRGHLPAPTFCAVMADTAMPTAKAGIWM